MKGVATLYTKEFFEAARAHLNPGGVVTLFVQLYDSSPAFSAMSLAWEAPAATESSMP